MLPSSSVISVSELNRLARQALEREFPLMWIAGEISNLTRAASGHYYFTLKDESAQARSVMFRSRAQSIPWRLENGQQVEARALVSLYEPRGDYQLNIEALRRAGIGRLFETFSRLKATLEAEGLFDPARKQNLPRYPLRIGIVTSPRAAALRDVLVTLRRRAPHLTAILYPCLVQGDGAAAEITAAIAQAVQRKECDLLLLVRGGGSLEDLWAFNDETLARTIAACPLPIISGIGHETDLTIADFVADLRAPTPTAAAEMASQGWYQASQELAQLRATLADAIQRRLAREQQRVDHLSLRLIHPATRLQKNRDGLALLNARLDAALHRRLRQERDRLHRLEVRLDRLTPRTHHHHARLQLLAQRLHAALAAIHHEKQHRMATLSSALEHLNPAATLARGFAIVRDSQGHVIRHTAGLHTNDTLHIDLSDGQLSVRIAEVLPAPAG